MRQATIVCAVGNIIYSIQIGNVPNMRYIAIFPKQVCPIRGVHGARVDPRLTLPSVSSGSARGQPAHATADRSNSLSSLSGRFH